MSQQPWGYEFEKDKTISSGSLLLSEPFMFDDNFKRTVVLICDHTKENGTVGLILNKVTDVKLEESIENFPPTDAKVYWGGPVGTDSLLMLHTRGNDIADSIHLGDGVYWGGDFEQVKHMILANQLQTNEIQFYLGYAGWGYDQLYDEMRESSWVVAKANRKLLFDAPRHNLWHHVLHQMGGVYKTMAGYPENPILN